MIIIPGLEIMYLRLSQIGIGVFGLQQILPPTTGIICINQ